MFKLKSSDNHFLLVLKQKAVQSKRLYNLELLANCFIKQNMIVRISGPYFG